MNNEKIIFNGERYTDFYVTDTYFLCSCGHKYNIKAFASSGVTSCKYCGCYLPRHLILQKHNKHKRAQQRNKSHGLKAFS